MAASVPYTNGRHDRERENTPDLAAGDARGEKAGALKAFRQPATGMSPTALFCTRLAANATPDRYTVHIPEWNTSEHMCYFYQVAVLRGVCCCLKSRLRATKTRAPGWTKTLRLL